MASPTTFFGANIVFGKNQEQYGDLPAFIDSSLPLLVTCWELDPEELREVIASGGKVFVLIHSTVMQPMQVLGKNPMLPTASGS